MIQPRWRLTDAPWSILHLKHDSRSIDRWLFFGAATLTVTLTPVMTFLQLQLGFGLALGLLFTAILVVIILVWPIAGIYALAICAVVVEQEALTHPIFTDHLYIFYWPVKLEGLPERPVGFLALFILVSIVIRRLGTHAGSPIKLGPLFWPFVALLACVAIGVAHGLSSGGNLRVIVLEIRPFWYLFLTYLLAYNLITHKRHAIAFLWITVLGTFIKALQGVSLVFGPLGGHISGQNEIMAHEQSFFFVLVLLIILLCVMLGRMRLLMWVASLSAPFVLIALVANNRRADYVAFLIAVVGAWLFAVVVRPERRVALITTAIVAGALFSGYVLAFQHSTGSIGSVANAVISVVRPSATDARDQSSNQYRYIENYDLKVTEQKSPIIGYGFGKPFLQPITLPNIASLDPYYLYIPHNTVLWIWMRLGPLGYIAFWYLVAAFIIRAGIITRRLRDPDLRLVAIFAIGAMLMEIPLAYGDYQLFFYRNIFFIGLLMGVTLRLPALDIPEIRTADAVQSATDPEPAPAPLTDSAALMGWQRVQRTGAGLTPTERVRSQALVHTPDNIFALTRRSLLSSLSRM